MDESALASAAALLWDERQQLEHLLYALTTQQLVISAGQSRWLGHSDAGVHAAMTAIQDAELLRSIEIKGLAEQLGVPAESSLDELAQAAPEPWSATFTDHRAALRGLALEIDATVAENRRLLQAGSKAIGEALHHIGQFSSTYNASGGAVRRGDGPTFLDEQL
jgi:hypothetical protein